MEALEGKLKLACIPWGDEAAAMAMMYAGHGSAAGSFLA